MHLAMHEDDPDEVDQRRVRPQRRVIPATREVVVRQAGHKRGRIRAHERKSASRSADDRSASVATGGGCSGSG